MVIDPLTVQRVREEVSLLELAKEHGLVMSRRGADWWAQCPFHAEKSGSFKVNEKANRYKCFGCGAGGDVIGFYMTTRGMDPKRGFPDAVRQLAVQAGILIEEGAAKSKPKRAKRTREEIEAEQARKRAVMLAERARMAKAEIVRQWQWTMAEMCEDSPLRLEDTGGLDAARAIVGLFEPEDLVWAGEPHHSLGKDKLNELPEGWSERRWAEWKAEVARHFRTQKEWLASGDLPGSRICASVFKQGNVFTRSLETVGRPRFLVAEHDTLSLDAQGAMLRWLREKVGLRLRAVVSTGGKSLHGWFDYPLPHDVARLKLMLCGVQEEVVVDGRGLRVWRGGLGFDAAMFNLVQPWKVPGWPHPKMGKEPCALMREQGLVYGRSALLWLGGKGGAA